ncbi:MAG: acyl-CoA thioesterase [Planctomycetaceae bacterium]|nr:MAG: acyl-CoA thioesterase [Planctomycetaceae bacterium]
MAKISKTVQFRVRYSEIDKMGTFYNSRALEWFEYGRGELLRTIGAPYVEMEAKGFCLPLIEAHLEYLGRAQYDDLLSLTTTVSMSGKARVRFDMQIVLASPCCPTAATGKKVVNGYTIHAITDPAGRPTRPPAWFVDAVNKTA